jgi:hypothetical protein
MIIMSKIEENCGHAAMHPPGPWDTAVTLPVSRSEIPIGLYDENKRPGVLLPPGQVADKRRAVRWRRLRGSHVVKVDSNIFVSN